MERPFTVDVEPSRQADERAILRLMLQQESTR
jgi:hypothetical protein